MRPTGVRTAGLRRNKGPRLGSGARSYGNGGAIAIGHPVAASAPRVLVTLLHEMQKRDARRALRRCASAAAWASRMCVARD